MRVSGRTFMCRVSNEGDNSNLYELLPWANRIYSDATFGKAVRVLWSKSGFLSISFTRLC